MAGSVSIHARGDLRHSEVVASEPSPVQCLDMNGVALRVLSIDIRSMLGRRTLIEGVGLLRAGRGEP